MSANSFVPKHLEGIFAIVLAAILWSTGGVFVKLLPQNAYTILSYRSILAGSVFLLFFGKKLLKMNGRAWLNAAFYCLLVLSFVVATKLTTAANAILLQYTGTIYVLLAEPYFFKLKMERVNIVTIIVCAIGMVILVSGDLSSGDMLGNLIALGSGILFAALFIGQRLNAPEYQAGSIFWGNIMMGLIGLPFLLQSPLPTLPEAGMLAFLGIFQLGLGYLLFTYGLKRVLAIEGALLAMLEPILNPVWVLIFYGEKPSLAAFFGGIIIIFALAARIVWMGRQKRKLRSIQGVARILGTMEK
ncbi:MAG: DMT family transporter [Saprospiraceae bacterium]|nr:DMT family transporter [Saprospiraceae bacterium]MCF8248532.1 DMT family transporter [Saprospiraceae bacterium]MCF8283069.1 DMT family transporter [Bacteroidales bacterium]MCF8310266.1 DMT family transporter [Saprospiraceae bacterium]MCF8439295.1 DMT family transporter [Saprospiraceae bacterium]